ncbi:MAG: hypothetical protein RLZZ93_1556 [Actinomycetota bacterium]
MRRLIGDAAWEGLPGKTRAERRREGHALQSELSLLRGSAPWSAADITQRVICANGSRASAGHNAPNSHPAEFVEQLIQPLLR